MLYSIGKDSSVMLRLAQKAFFPRKPPFPLLHVDTSYKFPETIAFRDWYAGEAGVVRSQSRTKLTRRNCGPAGTRTCEKSLWAESLVPRVAR